METAANNGYVNYQAMLSQINYGAIELEKICVELEMEERAQAIREVKTKLQDHTFSVGIMGEFKRGKSTVINALLGKEVLPADILPCSATLNQIKWDVKPRAEVRFKGGSVKEVEIDELANYVTKLTTESEQNAANVEDAVVYYPCQFCQNGVRIIDTPGLNDDERMNQVAESVLPTLDAIIMVIVPDAPFSISEADFVRNKVMVSDLGRIIFVINKIDMVRERDRQRVVDSIKAKIQTSVLEKVETLYGADSKEYAESKAKLGGIRIYPVSAMKALDGKLDGDEELLKESQMPKFEKALTQLLTEERGLLELIGPVNVVLGAAKEIREVIQMRKNAMDLDKAEFEKVQKKSMEEIQVIRRRKKEEVKNLEAKSQNIYSELVPMVDCIYEQMKERLLKYVDTCTMSDDDVKSEERKQAAAERIGKKLDEQMKVCLSENTEVLQMRIMDRLGDEMCRIEELNQDIMQSMGKIHGMIPKKTGMDSADIAGIVVDTVTSYSGVLAIGGIISGWKVNGIKGALVGGGAGFAAGYLAMTAALSLGVVGLPLALVGGVVSTFGGKAITKLVFGKQIAEREKEKLRSELKRSVVASVDMVKRQRMLENWLKETTDNVFYSLSKQLNQEVETMLSSTETTLRNIQVDLERSKANQESVLKQLETKENLLAEVCKALLPVKEKLDEARG
ncbi:MAG: dynamin family protein [Roseburia sp.]|nr:dynamin family protein [Roseburia sp.]